jgi:7-cyano-7-deazaguanine synthase in queuosine biosynthesis
MRVLLFTGGLDSVCAYYLLGEPRCVHVNLDGKTWNDAWNAHDDLGIPVEFAESRWDRDTHAPTSEDGHIPLRNLHLATVGALYGDRVILGAVRGESSPDKSDKFLRAASKALTAASKGRTIKVEAPLKHMTKRQLVAALITHVGEKRGREIVASTRSCYSLYHPRCGACMACFRRWVALSLNGIHEQHENPPWEWGVPTWGERLDYLLDAPLGEWPGIAQTNLEAWWALRSPLTPTPLLPLLLPPRVHQLFRSYQRLRGPRSPRSSRRDAGVPSSAP